MAKLSTQEIIDSIKEMKILEVKNLSKIYGKGDTMVKALDNISFSVEKGDNTLLLYCYQNGSLKVFPGRVSLLLNALELTEKMYPPRVSPRRLVLLYYFVYCKSFNVLSAFELLHILERKALQNYTKFLNWQNFLMIFSKNFIFNQNFYVLQHVFALYSGLSPKASAKLQLFHKPTKYFGNKFLRNFYPFCLYPYLSRLYTK